MADVVPDLPPPSSSFASDNAAGVDPAVIEAIGRANDGPALAYGDDPWTDRAVRAVREAFDAPVAVNLCWGGTGANVVGLASVLAPWEAVVTVDSAHIVTDEAGAPARFTGSSVITVPHVDGKLTPDAVTPYLHWVGEVHHPQPKVLSISQVTELGTVYSVEEIAALADLAHGHGLLLHVDGARIANALVASSTDLPALIRDTGVDLMTLGLTKTGAMAAEVVVHLRPELAGSVGLVRKQAGQLASKARFVAAQVTALLEGDRWLVNARRANAMAARLALGAAAIDGVSVEHAPQANAVFVRLPRSAIAPLQQWSFFWPWDPQRDLVRWMTGFSTTESDVDHFLRGVRGVVEQMHPIEEEPNDA